jgi:hypothetical protein
MVDFTMSLFANDDLMNVPWDSKLFKVITKPISSEVVPTNPNSNWNIWQPFDNKWATNTAVDTLPVSFNFRFGIPFF